MAVLESLHLTSPLQENLAGPTICWLKRYLSAFIYNPISVACGTWELKVHRDAVAFLTVAGDSGFVRSLSPKSFKTAKLNYGRTSDVFVRFYLVPEIAFSHPGRLFGLESLRVVEVPDSRNYVVTGIASSQVPAWRI
jgi:hypothetical protein